VSIVTDQALRLQGINARGARVVIQGIGNVGSYAARCLQETGALIVAISDSSSGLHNESGLDIEQVISYKQSNGTLRGCALGDSLTNEDLLTLPCDVLIPSAIEEQITHENADRVGARVIVEGANGPTTPEADHILEDRGILVVPDILANAGGVVVSYFEWAQNLQGYPWDEVDLAQRLERVMKTAFAEVADRTDRNQVTLRTAAYMIAVERVAEAMRVRGVYP